MKTAAEIYREYKIMPALQLHQLRVAAVAKLVCENFSVGGGSASGAQSVNERDVVLACLFHDMGNIIKSDLTTFPEFTEPEGIEYWKGIKEEFMGKYGNDSHGANVAIAKEIGLPSTAIALLDGVGFSKLAIILAGSSYELKICEYADTRVGPFGVNTIRERLTEARKRHDARQKRKDYYETDKNFELLSRAAHELEKQIFQYVSLKPEDINDGSINPFIEELRSYSF